MELKPSFDETPEPRHRRRSSHPRLVDEDGDVKPPRDDDEDENEAHEDEDSVAEETGGYEVDGPAWHGWIFAAVPVLIILLGSGRGSWSKGLAALLLGAVMMAFPPRRKLPNVALWCLLGVLLAPLAAFLPASVFGSGAWRATLASIDGLTVAGTITPQPWVTLEAWLILVLCASWLAWALARGFSFAQRRTMLRVLAGGGLVLVWLTIMEHLKIWTVPWWPRNAEWGEAFGPFANRNHTSSLAAITCVLCASAAYDAHRRKERSWIFFAVGFILPVMAIFMNTSRAGLLLLFLGMTLWLGTSAMRRGFFKKMAVSASLIFASAAVMFIADGGLAARMGDQGLEQLSAAGGRAAIYRDTLALTATAPWVGISLGNFDTVFALASAQLDPRMRFAHPESDFLWFLSEGGLLLVLPGLLLVLWILRSTGPWTGKKSKGRSHRQDRRLRNTAAIVLLLGILHGFVDVPNHGVGYAVLMALLAGITLRPRRLPHAAGWGGRVSSLAAGAAACVLGGVWMAIAFGNPVLPGTSSAEMLLSRAREQGASGSMADALPYLDRAIAMRPLDFALHFERARVRLRLRHPDDEVLADFTRARLLEPHASYMCYHEGVEWLPYRPDLAVLGWREFLRRFPKAGPGQHGYFRQMINHAQPYPELRMQLWSLASSLELKLDFLSSINSKEDFEFCLKDILSRQPDLAALDASQRMTIFEMWSRLGDRDALMAAIASSKQWQRDGGWKLLA
ncbi:MAG: O-antigen ligase family protein, partial [Verrucomicrobiaceae bacterium]|nr:O-antigen ligase family protein [Verrucomicrobiaceae bacterium]